MKHDIRKRALITGITGQDGSYLAEFLLSKGYEVHGIVRRASTFNTQRIDRIYIDPHDPDARLFLYYGDLSDSEQVSSIIYNVKPDEIYNLGAQSHVRVSFDVPEYTSNITALGTTRILETIRRSGYNIKFYQASSGDMFGDTAGPQDENTPFRPRSPYACAKLYSYWMARNYRQGYGIFASNGILFNHESVRRGETFLSRKISRAVASILAKRQDHLYLGNLKAKRNWGFAPEYVEMMWAILQQNSPDDFVVGSDETHSVREFVKEAFSYAGLDWQKHVKIDARYFRPTEVNASCANSKKAKARLKWAPKVGFKDLVRIMIDADMRFLDLEPIGQGDAILRQKFPDRWWRAD